MLVRRHRPRVAAAPGAALDRAPATGLGRSVRRRIDWTWAFVLDPVDGGRTRFVFRTRARLRPWWVTAFHPAVIVPADFVMSRQMLHGVRERAERTTAADLARLASGSIAPAAGDLRPGTRPGAAEQRGPVRPLGRG
jgi:hypothetical protein